MTTLETSNIYALGDDRYRVRVVLDDDPGDGPRDWDNGSILITYGREYGSPDKTDELPDVLSEAVDYWSERVERGEVNATAIARWARTYARDEILAVGGLTRQPHDGTLSLDMTPDTGARYEGLAIVSRESWVKVMGDSDPGADPTPAELLRQDVDVYNQWARGEVYGFIIERAVLGGWDTYESLWGMMSDDGPDYAMREGLAALPDGATDTGSKTLD